MKNAVVTRDAIARRELSAVEATRASLDAIHKHDGTINAFLQVFDDHALNQARVIDDRIARGEEVGPLAGVPVALKDNICLNYGKTTCASRILENYQSPFTATAVQRLIDAGAVIVGKTNMDEFGMGSSTENSAFKPTRHPRDHSRVPGGSSGGSAAAVAAGMVPLALGSDTGGSIRQPSALCGIVGFKPTYGMVSRYGLVAYASSLDQIGPLAPSVADCALAMNVIAGPDRLDSTSADVPFVDFTKHLDDPIVDLRIGVPREARSSSNHPSVNAAMERAIAALQSTGAQIVDVELPNLKHGIAAYYLVATAEASSNLARFDGVRYGRRAELKPNEDLFDLYARSRAEGFGAEVRKRIMLGTYALSAGYYDAYYLTALKVRRLIKQDFDKVFAAGCHAILTPTTPNPAFKIGEKTSDPLAMYLEDVYTVTANLAGVCAISVPANQKIADELPIGVQLTGAAFDDARLLRIGRMLEASLS